MNSHLYRHLCAGVSQDPDPVFLGAAEELFTGLEARSVSAADLLGLEQLKTLLLLQDAETLQRALQLFSEHCAMSPGVCCQGVGAPAAAGVSAVEQPTAGVQKRRHIDAVDLELPPLSAPFH